MDADKQPSHLFFLVTKSFESEKKQQWLWPMGLWALIFHTGG